jgi:ATP-dependent Clp protease ATP-binding subunit ClpA
MLPDDAEDDLNRLDIRGWQPPRPRPGAPSYGRTALTALHSASAAARRAGHPFAGTTHLLMAALADLNGPAARLLHRLGAKPERIRSDAGDRLGGPGERGQPATP